MTLRPFDAIIFDHDGTLIDTETPDFEACCLLYTEFGLTLTLEYWAETVVGHWGGYKIMFQKIIEADQPELTEEDLWKRLKALHKITFEHVELMPGVITLLPKLRTAGYPLGVATASSRTWLMRWLTHFDLLDYFQVTANQGDVANNKPAPDVYLFAAEQLGVRPERCLVFEDSVAGTKAAKAAGMTVMAVPNHVTKSLDFSQADYVLERGLTDVSPEWLTTL